MYNLLPGQGLGFTPSKLMAFGLGYITGEVVETQSGGGGVVYYDDGLRTLQRDDKDMVEILTVIAASGALK